MSGFLGKLGFIHRRLWREDGLYRAALLSGPAPLLGGLLAGALWAGIQALHAPTYRLPQWATVRPGPAFWNTDQSQTVQPAIALPPIGVDSRLVGYEAGWRVTTHPIQVSPMMDVEVKPTPLTAFSLDAPAVDMAQLIAEGPQMSLYVGEGRGFFAVRTAGVYAVTVSIERAAGPIANCVMRLGFGPRRIMSNVRIGFGNETATYDAPRFDLQPGLYPVIWVFGCWHDHEVVGPGRMTLLIAHPGDPMPLPARADDIVRQVQSSP